MHSRAQKVPLPIIVLWEVQLPQLYEPPGWDLATVGLSPPPLGRVSQQLGELKREGALWPHLRAHLDPLINSLWVSADTDGWAQAGERRKR